MKKWPILLVIIFIVFIDSVRSQSKNNWKLSRQIDNKEERSNNKFLFNILFKDSLAIQEYIKRKAEGATYLLKEQNILTIQTSYNKIVEEFLNKQEVLYINVTSQKPKEELAVKGFDLSANSVSTVQNKYPNIKGEGQTVSIKENNYDTTDIDLKGRTRYSPLASGFINNHANFMATIIAGADNSIYYSKGVAWGAMMSSSSFDQILPDPNSYYDQYKITVQNHSY